MKLNPEIYRATAKDSLCDVFVGAWITVIACFSFQQRKQKGVGQNSPVSVVVTNTRVHLVTSHVMD